MKNNIRFYVRLIAFGFLAISALNIPVSSATLERPNLTLLVPQVVTRCGPVTINGFGFGAKGSGYVLIGGQRAFTTTWTNTQIVAYVPESAVVGQNAVEIVTRSRDCNWRFLHPCT
jgi:IPT/TIG domain